MNLSRTLRALTVASTTMLLVLLAACGGNGDDSTPTPLPTATPTSTPSPSPTATASPSPTPTSPAPTPTVPAIDPAIVEHGDRASMQVALTFDMGGRVDPALDIMAFLLENDVHATIFMTGAMADNVNTDYGRQVLGIVCDNPGVFDLGNHSYSHPDFRDLSAEQIQDELATTETAIAPHCDLPARPVFRPPFGGIDADVAATVADAGYPLSIMWDVDTIDWRPEADGGPTAADIAEKVLANAEGGSIVLMHLGGYNTLEALPAMVNGLRDAGYELVTVRELLGIAP